MFKIGPGYIQSGDPFGLFTLRKQLSTPLEKLVVYPYFEKLDNIFFIPGNEMGGINLRKQTPITTPQAAGIRDYLPGDPLNRVHWPKTAKMNKLMVKEFDEDTQSNVWIFLDAQNDVHKREPNNCSNEKVQPIPFFNKKTNYQLPQDSFEYAISIASSLTDFYIRKNKSVGLVCFSEQAHILTPDKGRNQYTKIIDLLTLIRDNGYYPINILLEKQIKNIPLGSSIILITPVSEKVIRNEIETIKSRGIKLVTIQINADSFMVGKDKSINGQDAGEIITIKFGDNIRMKLAFK